MNENKITSAINHIMKPLNESMSKIEEYKVNGNYDGLIQETNKAIEKVKELKEQFATSGGVGLDKDLQEALRNAQSHIQEYANFINSNKDKLSMDDISKAATQNFDTLKSKISEISQVFEQTANNPALDNIKKKLEDISDVKFDISEKAQKFNEQLKEMEQSVENLKNNVQEKINSIDFGKIGGDNGLNNLNNSLNEIFQKVQEAREKVDGEVGKMLSGDNLSTDNVTEKLSSFVTDISKVGEDVERVSKSISNTFGDLFGDLSSKVDKDTIESLKELSSVLMALSNNNIEVNNPLSDIIESLEKISDEKIENLNALSNSLNSILNIPMDGNSTANQLLELATGLELLNSTVDDGKNEDIKRLSDSLESLSNLNIDTSVFEQLSNSIGSISGIADSLEKMKEILQPSSFQNINDQFKEMQQSARDIASSLTNIQMPSTSGFNSSLPAGASSSFIPNGAPTGQPMGPNPNFQFYVDRSLEEHDFDAIDNNSISQLNKSHSRGYKGIQSNANSVKKSANTARLSNLSSGSMGYKQGDLSNDKLEDIADLARELEAEMNKLNQVREDFNDSANDPSRREETVENARSLNNHQLKMNNLGKQIANSSKMSAKDAKNAPPEVKQVLDSVKGLLDNTKSSNSEMMQLNELLGLDDANESLIKTHGELDKVSKKINESSWDKFSKGAKEAGSSIVQNITGPLDKVSSLLKGGMSTIGLGSISAYASNPLSLKGLANIGGQFVGDVMGAYTDQGRTVADSRQAELMAYGGNYASNGRQLVNEGLALQLQTHGRIQSPELNQSYQGMVKNVVGQSGQNDMKNQYDMTELADAGLMMQKGWGIGEGQAQGAVQTFYRELGKNVKETEYELAKIGQTAQSLNIPFDKHLEAVTSMAVQYKTIGFEADYAGNVIGNLQFQHNMTAPEAQKMAGDIGGALTTMPEGWLAYGAGMSGMYDDPLQAIMDLQYGFNDDGTLKEGVAEKQAEIFTNNYQMMGGMQGSSGDYAMAQVLEANGITDKKQVAKFINHADDPEYITNLFKEHASMTTNDEGEKTVDADDPMAYFMEGADSVLGKLSEAATELSEIDQALNAYKTGIEEIASLNDTMFDTMFNFDKQIYGAISALGDFIGGLDDSIGGFDLSGITDKMDVILGALAAGLGAYAIAKTVGVVKTGKKIYDKVTGKGKKNKKNNNNPDSDADRDRNRNNGNDPDGRPPVAGGTGNNRDNLTADQRRRQEIVDAEEADRKNRIDQSYKANKASGQNSTEALENARREENLRSNSRFNRPGQAEYEDLFNRPSNSAGKGKLKNLVKGSNALLTVATAGVGAYQLNKSFNNMDSLAHITGQDTTKEKASEAFDWGSTLAMVSGGATGGAAVGTALFPGVGTGVGLGIGALGGLIGGGAGMLADWGLEKSGAKDWFKEQFGIDDKEVKASISQNIKTDGKSFAKRMDKNYGFSINEEQGLVAAAAMDKNKDNLKGMAQMDKDAWGLNFTDEYLKQIAKGTDPAQAEKIAKQSADQLDKLIFSQDALNDLNSNQLDQMVELWKMSGANKDELTEYSKNFFKTEKESRKVLELTAESTGLTVPQLESIAAGIGLLPNQLAAIIAKDAGGKDKVKDNFDNGDELTKLETKLKNSGMKDGEAKVALKAYKENNGAIKKMNMTEDETVQWLKAYGHSATNLATDPTKYANNKVQDYKKAAGVWNGGLFDGYVDTIKDGKWDAYYKNAEIPKGMTAKSVVGKFAATTGMASDDLSSLMKNSGVSEDKFAKYLLSANGSGNFTADNTSTLLGKKMDAAFEQQKQIEADNQTFLDKQAGETHGVLNKNNETLKESDSKIQEKDEKFKETLQSAKKEADLFNTNTIVGALGGVGSLLTSKLGELGAAISSIVTGNGGSMGGGAGGGDFVDQVAQLIGANEGDYGSVNKDDNGALSIGKLQWHGNRARDLLKDVQKRDPEAYAKSLQGLGLKGLDSDWSKYKLNESQAKGLSSLLDKSGAGREAQDDLIKKDVNGYIEKGKSYGITDPSALAYFADLENQSPKQAKVIASAAGKGASLDQLHQAAMKNGVMSNYASRRQSAYKNAKGITSGGDAGGDSVANWYYDQYNVTSKFGAKEAFRSSAHTGVDFDGKMGDPIKNILGGKVLSVSTGHVKGEKNSAGNQVQVQHSDGSVAQYNHLKDVLVKVGEMVTSGQKIGTMGNTGSVVGADGSHLDLKYGINGKYSDPEKWLKSLMSGGFADAGGESVDSDYLDAINKNTESTDKLTTTSGKLAESQDKKAFGAILTNTSAYNPFSGIHPTNDTSNYNQRTFDLYSQKGMGSMSENDSGVNMQDFARNARQKFDISLKTSVDPTQHPNFTQLIDKHMKVAVEGAVKEATEGMSDAYTKEFSEIWSTVSSSVSKGKNID